MLNQNNILSVPISTNTVLTKASDNTTTLLEEKVTEFTATNDGNIKPLRTLEQRFKQPSTNLSSIYVGPGDISNPVYKETQTFTYDVQGNLIGLKDEGNHVVSNIYGYDDKYVIASVVNADPILDKPAYTSFENYTTGRWNIYGLALIGEAPGVTGSYINRNRYIKYPNCPSKRI